MLRTSGKNPSGKRKGGIKVHTLIRSDQDVPCMIRYSAAVANDSQFLKEIFLPKGSILVFDRGYCDYTTLNRFANDNITWVTRRRKQLTYKVLQGYKKADDDKTIISDEKIQLGFRSGTKVKARLVRYKDLVSGETYEFISNNFRMKATTIARLYQNRWQIELLFKRMKQNYPLKYFLGDSENAIQIQIWCSLIADLILKIVKKGVAAKWSFSNLAAMVRLHLMTYIDLASFLRSPEKALMQVFVKARKYSYKQLLLIT
ncbi:MAG TPA: IS4 family transposase [Mucilaginibacter sp.]|nr:IS4 family transposase [Mucilaginibacter sp.]